MNGKLQNIHEMTMRVSFCLLYDCFKWDFVSINVEVISTENNVVMDNIMTLWPVKKSYVTCGQICFMM